MGIQVSLLSKCFLAKKTFKWPLSSMSPGVDDQLTLGYASLWAIFTLVSFLLCFLMDFQMLLQMKSQLEAFWTNVACEVFCWLHFLCFSSQGVHIGYWQTKSSSVVFEPFGTLQSDHYFFSNSTQKQRELCHSWEWPFNCVQQHTMQDNAMQMRMKEKTAPSESNQGIGQKHISSTIFLNDKG